MKILTLNASPITDGSTDLLLGKIAESIEAAASEPVENIIVRLNDFVITPCQSCGFSPEPDWCVLHDAIYPVYNQLVNCDIVLFGTPVYFDTVSAQAKLFIDRCNCLRPVNFETHEFKFLPIPKRRGAIVLVGSERQKFECARTVIAGFFKWVRIENTGLITYSGSGFSPGAVKNNSEALEKAEKLGKLISQSRSD